MEQRTLTVRQLNTYVKSLLEGDVRLAFISVCGEISNFKNHTSGHYYFTLKDENAAVKCVMFKAYAMRCTTPLKDGVSVTVSGKVSLFERDGTFQLYAETVTPLGLGEIGENLEALKQKLLAEGIFDRAHKLPLPAFPKRVAVVTSPTGAALQDVRNVISRRYPVCELLLCPVTVQGENAAASVIRALDLLALDGTADVIIIARGGGSSEDLGAFNDEKLARRIYAMKIPVVSAVGHETDTTVCDLAADVRVPTPSAAAEVTVPDKDELLQHIRRLSSSMCASLYGTLRISESRFESAVKRSALTRPELFLEKKQTALKNVYARIISAENEMLKNSQLKLLRIGEKLDVMSPVKVMTRGFAAVSSGGTPVHSVDDVAAGDEITLRLNDGRLECNVFNKEKNNG